MTEDNLIGAQFDEYQLETLLGEGGMARVYKARDIYLHRYAAVKVAAPTYRTDRDYLERFEKEARAIARLDHPHIVRLYRYGEAHGLLYMAMQYIEGLDLGSLLQGYREDGEFIEYSDARRLVHQVGLALDYVHSQDIIHRDVKSSNIILDKTGKAYLADFGLVLLKQFGTRGLIFGSPHYMAPEQALSSARAVPQSDLYSLGVIAWEMFTGQLPFDAKEPLEVAMQHLNQAPPQPRSLRPELPLALEAVLLKALAKKPEDRYQSGAELAAAVEAAAALPGSRPIPVPTTARKTIPQRILTEKSKKDPAGQQ
jgi:serine/threonine-protein kinase